MAHPSALAAKRQDAVFEIIELPNKLKEKVGSGGFDPVALRRAEIAVDELAVDYEKRLQEEVGAFDEAFRAMRRTGVYDLRSLYAYAHRLRGEAGTYGYPLITAIGNTLARYLDSCETLDAVGCEIVESHISALRAVAFRKVKGDGGEIGAQVVEGLAQMVTRALA